VTDETVADAALTPAFRQRALELATRPRGLAGAQFRNVWGAVGLHGGPQEWVHDFQSIFAGSDSRVSTRRQADLTCAAGATATGESGDYAAFLRYATRGSVEGRTASGNLGFRCARTP
jgi:formylglycine-generating enzyme